MLPDTQKKFFDAIVEGETPTGLIEGDARLDAEARLDIYRNAYRWRLQGALMENFPALHTLAGDELFEQISLAYIAAHPSQHYSIRYFGHRLSDFLSTHESWREQRVLAEMATFEWALRHAFDAADDEALDVTALGQVSAEAWDWLRFRFHDSVSLLSLHTNAPQLWQAVDEQLPPQAVEQSEQAVFWLVWRDGMKNFFRSLSQEEAGVLQALLAGETFAAVCEVQATRMDDEAVPFVAALVRQWFEQSLISGLVTSA